MPPSSPRDSDNILVDKPELYYTNEDVAILHEIVVHAEELLPNLPERERVPTNALFHAYYAILPTLGLHTDHDSRYARVLFKIGGSRGSGSLYEKFEAVLSRMGIEIQFDQEISHADNDSARNGHTFERSRSPPDSASALAPMGQSRGRRRRKSESSVWETDPDSHGKRETPYRPHSFSRAIPSLTTKNLCNSSLPVQGVEKGNTAHLYHSQSGGEKQGGKGRTLTAWLSTRLDDDLRGPSTGSTPAQKNVVIERRSPSLPTVRDADTGSAVLVPHGNQVIASNLQHINAVESGNKEAANHQHPQLPLPMLETLSIKLSLFKQYQSRNLVRRTWAQWRGRTLQLQENNSNLELVAKHHDREALLQQAIFLWQASVRSRKQEAETEHFFAHLGRRACRARDLFLLTKAYTHWAKSASDEGQLTSVARRHILRARYFNAWLEITAVNELKVRRQILRKFFATWQKNYASIMAAMVKAVIVFEDSLVEKTFWTWVWSFYEQRVPILWAIKKKREVFSMWTAATQMGTEDENMAIERYCYASKRNIFFNWAMKLRQHVTRESEALESSDTLLSYRAFIHWRHELSLMPVLDRLRDIIAVRLRRDSLRIWLLRTKQEMHATSLDRVKVTREAWATWTDKVRCQAFRSCIDDRLLFQGLYRWVLRERLILVRRLVDRGLMRIVLQTMAARLSCAVRRESEDSELAKCFANRVLTNYTMMKLRSCLKIQQRRDRIVTQYHSPRLLNRVISLWINRAQRMSQLHEWSDNADFYFRAGGTLKKWGKATERIRREKIRKAYRHVRRRNKIIHILELLSVWRRQAGSITEMRDLAIENLHNKNIMFALEIFDLWRGTTEQTMELELMCEQILLKRRVNDMRRALSVRQRLEIEAIRYFEDCTISLVLKKWGRLALQHRAGRHLANELCEKQGKKILRKIISHWSQRGSETRQRVHRRRNTSIGPSKSTAETAEVWSELGDGPYINAWTTTGINTPTLLPAYLNTPSRKPSRLRMVARFSTTPTAPLSTPFEKHLRAQYWDRPDIPSQKDLGE